MEDKDEKVIEEDSQEVEEEKIDTADDLMKEKADNEFIARENTAQIQIFVQNANFDNKRDIKQVFDLVNSSKENDKKYDLQKLEDCVNFFDICKSKDYIALVIILSIFEIVPIGDYANLKDMLIEYLPSVSHIDTEGKEIYVQQTNSYISLNSALAVIGGKSFITGDGQQSIGFGEDYEEVLSNIWLQFPDLRKPIISWLFRINDLIEYKTSFEAYQIVNAFIRIITKDFQYAKKYVFDRMYSEENNLGILARLMQELLGVEKYKADSLNIVIGWMESESDWLWKSALLVCLRTYSLDIEKKLQKAMICSIKKRILGLQNSDLKFIVLFASNSKNVRTIMSFVFCDTYKSCSLKGKEKLARIYLKMIRYGYYQVNKDKIDLPFVICDSKEQIENIEYILAFIMKQYDLYSQLCWILQAYIEEISGYEVSHGTLDHFTAFFYVLTRQEYDFQKDFLLFLSDLKGSFARDIYDKLLKIYGNNRGKKDE